MTGKKRLIVILCAALAGLLLAGLFATAEKYAQHSGAKGELQPVTDDAFGGKFTLTDQDGRIVTDKDFAGSYRLIYFGFTFCPAICPTELSKMTSALNLLGDRAASVKPIFITVDPERDTPAKLKPYVAMFHPSLTGLTGTPEQIKSVLKEFKIYAAKRQDETMSEYTMDHTSWILFLAPDGRLLRIFKSEESAQEMADGIGQWLANDKS